MENNNALITKLNKKIEHCLDHGEYEKADRICRELCLIRGLTPADHMPENFLEKLTRKEHETMHKSKTPRRLSGIVAAAAAAVLLIGGPASAAVLYNNNVRLSIKGLTTGENIDVSFHPEEGEPLHVDLPEMSGENTITPVSEEKGTSSTPWLNKKVWDETYEVWDSDDAVNWTKGYQTTRVTEYRYADYFTAAEHAGFEKPFRTNYTGDVFYYEWEHLPEESDMAAGTDSTMDYGITGEFSCGNGHFSIDQQKYRETEAEDAAGTASMVITTTGETGNEREYLNASGISFKLSDDTETGETRTTTIFTSDTCEMILQFKGLTEEEIYEVLDQITP